jgi:SAM-dependent methyltransferase
VTSAEGFEPRAFELLPEAEAGSFWFRSRNRLIVWALRRYFPGARSFLEVGCGTGFVLQGLRETFPGLELTGVELYAEGLEVARRRVPDARLVQVDARELPFDAEFDVVGSFDVLEHIEDDEAALAAIFRATAPGGGAVLAVPQHPRLWSAADEFGKHVRRYRRRELVAKVGRAGFRVERVTSFVTLLLPLMAVSRVTHRRLDESYDPVAELRHSRPLDLSLERVMDIERTLIRAGISLPAGGSLLVVARRG